MIRLNKVDYLHNLYNNIIKINSTSVRCGSHLVIWDLEEHLRSLELSSFVLSKNIEDGVKQSSALAYVLHLYELYRSYISDQRLVT